MKNLITAEPAVTEITFEEQNEMNTDITSVRGLLKRQKSQKGSIFSSSKIDDRIIKANNNNEYEMNKVKNYNVHNIDV